MRNRRGAEGEEAFSRQSRRRERGFRGEVTRTDDRWEARSEGTRGMRSCVPGLAQRSRRRNRWRWGVQTRRVPQPPGVRPCTPWSRLDKRMRRRRGALVVRRSGGSARSGRGFERACLERPRDGVVGTRRLRARVCVRGLGFGALRQTRGTSVFLLFARTRRTSIPTRHLALAATLNSAPAAVMAVRGKMRGCHRSLRRAEKNGTFSPRGVAATPRCPSRWTSSWCRARLS